MSPGKSPRDPLLTKMEAGESYEFDQLLQLSGMPAPKLLTRLMELELSGQIEGGPRRAVHPGRLATIW